MCRRDVQSGMRGWTTIVSSPQLAVNGHMSLVALVSRAVDSHDLCIRY